MEETVNMKTLQEIYKNNKSDKGSVHSYIDEYAKLFEYIRHDALKVLEIGIGSLGHPSLTMWSEYFTNAQIYGVDIELFLSNSDKISTFKMSQTDPNIAKISQEFDVIIDDGSHYVQDQVESFNLLWPLLSKNGIYVIEDIRDLNQSKDIWPKLHPSCKILDLRSVKNRYDDVLVVYKK